MKKIDEKLKRKEEGLTLVALVITIVVLIMLALISINAIWGDNGLIKQAEYAKDLSSNTTESQFEGMDEIYDEYANMMTEDNQISKPEEPTIPSTVEEAKESEDVFEETTIIEDGVGNKITIPGGFKIPEDSGDTVQEGIVIEDVSASTDTNVQGSQYVWIPVGKFIKDDKTEITIVLGRYTFDASNGTPKLEQPAYTEDIADNYTASVRILTYMTELSVYREGIDNRTSGLNATAKDLKGFVESVKENGGYYIGRYEASYANGADSTTSISDYSKGKAASKKSTAYRVSADESMQYIAGTLWNFINQINSSKVAINTYEDSTSVKSDLINSYAWDTAIVYIQEAGNTNYANKFGYSINSSLANTGENGDEVCKINDMASNEVEFTTEYSSYVYNGNVPGVARGGGYGFSNGVYKTAYRDTVTTPAASSFQSFRVQLYIV